LSAYFIRILIRFSLALQSNPVAYNWPAIAKGCTPLGSGVQIILAGIENFQPEPKPELNPLIAKSSHVILMYTLNLLVILNLQ